MSLAPELILGGVNRQAERKEQRKRGGRKALRREERGSRQKGKKLFAISFYS